MLNYNKLNKSFEESKYSKREFCEKCGFTRPTLDGLLAGGDVKISTIIAFAKLVGCPVSYFFDENAYVSNSVVKSPHAIAAGRDAQLIHNEASVQEVELLKKLCDEKDERIKELKEIIQILKEK